MDYQGHSTIYVDRVDRIDSTYGLYHSLNECDSYPRTAARSLEPLARRVPPLDPTGVKGRAGGD